MSKKQKQSWNLLDPRSFDIYMNAAIPMIVMLDCLEVDTEVLDIYIESIESNDYKEASGNNRDTNSMFVAI